MITKAQLVNGLASFKEQLDKEVEKANALGKKYQMMYNQAQKGMVSEKRIADLLFEVHAAEKRAERCYGAVQGIEWQIEKIDLEEKDGVFDDNEIAA